MATGGKGGAPMYPGGYQGTAPPLYNSVPQVGAQGMGPPPPYTTNPYGGYPPMVQPQAGPPPPYPQGPQTVVYMPTGFDSGARFDGHARPNVPPPPPGVAPNPAQMAMMQGHTTVVGQKKSSFWTGGGGAGTTFW